MCDYIYANGARCNEKTDTCRCEFHDHTIFKTRNIKEILKNGLGNDYDKIVDWIREHPENIEDGSPIEQDQYGCGANYSSAYIILIYLESFDKHGRSCIIPYPNGKW
jgi:hypothetical protein